LASSVVIDLRNSEDTNHNDLMDIQSANHEECDHSKRVTLDLTAAFAEADDEVYNEDDVDDVDDVDDDGDEDDEANKENAVEDGDLLVPLPPVTLIPTDQDTSAFLTVLPKTCSVVYRCVHIKEYNITLSTGSFIEGHSKVYLGTVQMATIDEHQEQTKYNHLYCQLADINRFKGNINIL
jgi:hypothetical protein